MNEHYQKLLNMTYQECCKFLLKKYGVAKEDYFSEKSYQRFKDGEIKSPAKKKFSRTVEGLYCHHMDEDKQILIANPEIIKKFDVPYDYQRKDRLVYCNLIEHGILHVLIATESFENKTSSKDNQALGVGGYINFIRPNLVQWLVMDIVPKAQWMVNCRNAILMENSEAEILIKEIDKFLIKNYPINQKAIDFAYKQYVTALQGYNS